MPRATWLRRESTVALTARRWTLRRRRSLPPRFLSRNTRPSECHPWCGLCCLLDAIEGTSAHPSVLHVCIVSFFGVASCGQKEAGSIYTSVCQGQRVGRPVACRGAGDDQFSVGVLLVSVARLSVLTPRASDVLFFLPEQRCVCSSMYVGVIRTSFRVSELVHLFFCEGQSCSCLLRTARSALAVT